VREHLGDYPFQKGDEVIFVQNRVQMKKCN
jgi:hypothetical protein